MHGTFTPGRLLFALSMLAFGIEHFVQARFGAGLGPPFILGRPLWLCFMGAILLLTGASLPAPRQARAGATLLGVVFLLYGLGFYAPKLVANLHDPGPWTSLFEVLALCGAAFALAGNLPTEWPQSVSRESSEDMTSIVGRGLFAAALVVFAVQHFMYAKFVATLVPAWIPAHLFWAWFVGAAFLASAIAIATKIQIRLAGTSLGTMFLLWVLLLHAPRVIAASHNGNEWTSMLIALAMSGASWIIAAAG
jgi:uncharacterized membrane protein